MSFTFEEIKDVLETVSFSDIEKADVPKDAIPRLVSAKIALIQNMAMDGFLPVRAFPDGRVIVQYKGDLAEHKANPFRQVHGKHVDDHKFGLVAYTVPTVEGLPIDNEIINPERLKHMMQPGKGVEFSNEEDKCPCPNCTAQRLRDASAEAEARQAFDAPETLKRGKNETLH